VSLAPCFSSHFGPWVSATAPNPPRFFDHYRTQRRQQAPAQRVWGTLSHKKSSLATNVNTKYTILELYKKRSYPMAKDRMQRLGPCIWQLDGVHKLSSKVTTPSWFASSFHNVPMCLKSNMNSFVARALKDQRSETQQVSEVPWQTGIHWHLLDSSSIYWLHFVYRNNTEQHTDKPVKPMGIFLASGVARRCSALNVSTGSCELRDLLCLAVSMSTEPPHECRPVAK